MCMNLCELKRTNNVHSCTGITMPPIIQKQGRPKGHEVTVIGLPAKKQKKSTSESSKAKLQPFIKLHTSIKEKGIQYYM